MTLINITHLEIMWRPGSSDEFNELDLLHQIESLNAKNNDKFGLHRHKWSTVNP